MGKTTRPSKNLIAPPLFVKRLRTSLCPIRCAGRACCTLGHRLHTRTRLRQGFVHGVPRALERLSNLRDRNPPVGHLLRQVLLLSRQFGLAAPFPTTGTSRSNTSMD